MHRNLLEDWGNVSAIQCLPYKHENLSSDPSTHVKFIIVTHIHNPMPGRGRDRRILAAHYQLEKCNALGWVDNPVLIIRWNWSRRKADINVFPLHTCTYTCTHLHIHMHESTFPPWTYTCTSPHLHIHMHTPTSLYLHIMHKCTWMYTHTRTGIYTHTHTHRAAYNFNTGTDNHRLLIMHQDWVPYEATGNFW